MKRKLKEVFAEEIFAEDIFANLPLILENKFREVNQNSPFAKINSVKVYIFLKVIWNKIQ